MTHNPSLREEPRNQKAAVISSKQESSLLDWLETSGRMLARDNTEYDYLDDEEEISELMAGDNSYDDVDDDDDDDLDLEEL
jgi:hypothetical protein